MLRAPPAAMTRVRSQSPAPPALRPARRGNHAA